MTDGGRSPRRRVLGTLLAMTSLLVGCGRVGQDAEVLPPTAEVYAATLTGDGTELGLAIALCQRPLLELRVEETADEVRVLARTGAGPDPADSAIEVRRRLDAPLGDRVIVDDSTGQVVTRIDDLTGD